MKIEFWRRQIFEILIIHNSSLGHVRSHTKFGPDRFTLFDVYWIQTDRQTDKQSIYIDIILSGAYLGIFFFRGGGRGSESTPIGTQRNPRNYRFHGSRRGSPHSPPPLCVRLRILYYTSVLDPIFHPMNIQIHSSNFPQLIVINILRFILPDHVTWL